MPLTASKLTPFQRSTLVSFVRRYRAENDRGADGILDKDFGALRCLDHLCRKGALKVVREVYGPRGGEYFLLAPTPEGLKLADHIVVNNIKTWR